MNLSELTKNPHLSASQINQYLDCSLAYRFARIDGVKPEFIADALVFGTVMHRVIEFYHHQRMLGDKPSLMDTTRMFEELWTKSAKDNQDIRYKEGTDFESYLINGKSQLATYYTQFPETGFEVVALEQAFSFHVDGLPLPIIGAIDMIEQDEGGTVIVSDFKTTGRAYSTDEIDNNFQLTVYQMALKANGFANKELILRLDCLVKTRKPKLEQYYSIRTEEDEKRAVKKMLSVWDGISKGVFIPNDNSWKCKTCCYCEHCSKWLQS